MIFYSSIEPVYYILPLIGFIVGFFGTILGGGGGFFFLPVLTLLIGVDAQTAVITSLSATLPICFVGTIGHFKAGNINFKIGALFALAGVVGAFVGAAITGAISSEQLKLGFGIYSIILALNIVVDTWRKSRAKASRIEQNPSKLLSISKASFFGFFAGTITGTFGTSGTAPVLAGLFTMKIPLKLVIGTSLLIVLINTFFAVGAHFLVGQIDLTLVGFLSTGSLIGAILGPRFLSKLKTDKSENKVKYIYAAVFVLIGILMMLD